MSITADGELSNTHWFNINVMFTQCSLQPHQLRASPKCLHDVISTFNCENTHKIHKRKCQISQHHGTNNARFTHLCNTIAMSQDNVAHDL